ncbi:MAG: LacI family DNA-binding transcriptional regulator [Henriciella sp.]|nr:LacI family DNA-binding transcriptional regulator [Hyphomonadaceae bacterium]
MNKKQTATIKDVAELARVSQMTVSRVLNDQSAVKETTRKRVQAAMRELNYRPNIMARNLAGRAGLFIGLIYRNPSYGYLSEFLLGALDTCRKLGHYLIVEEPLVDDNMVDLEQIEKRFLDTSIQALIVVPPLSDDPKLIDTLERTGISFVCVSPKLDAYTGPSVRMDDVAAAGEMTGYLLNLGHNQIGLIKGPPDHMSSELRLAGYRNAYRERDKVVEEDLIVSGDFTYVSGMQAASKLLSRPKPPTAIFACNDDMAAGAIAAAHQAGLRVPQDVSIVGFDDTANASALWPPLTTVRQPIRDMASSAIEILARRVAQSKAKVPTRTENLTLDHELVIRQSAAAPTQID